MIKKIIVVVLCTFTLSSCSAFIHGSWNNGQPRNYNEPGKGW